MVIFYRNVKKYYEIQLTKNKMNLSIRKMTNNAPFPEVMTAYRIPIQSQ